MAMLVRAAVTVEAERPDGESHGEDQRQPDRPAHAPQRDIRFQIALADGAQPYQHANQAAGDEDGGDRKGEKSGSQRTMRIGQDGRIDRQESVKRRDSFAQAQVLRHGQGVMPGAVHLVFDYIGVRQNVNS